MIELVAERLSAVHDLCRKNYVKQLELFGSAATGEFDPAHSDIDLLVQFEPEAPVHFLDFLIELEDLFGRKVDLLEASAVRNPYLIREINRQRVPVYVA